MLRHVVIFAEQGRFADWPANNGAWIWDGGEILVGFAEGGYAVQPGHNIVEPITCLLARSRDGGVSWQVEKPANFVGRSGAPLDPPGNIPFGHPDFALRVMGIGYHGCEDPRGAFFYSQNRGRTWRGPYTFGALNGHPQLRGMEFTPRTDYVVNGPRDCLVMLSARQPGVGGADRVFCARTTDGGASFQFVSWVVPPSDPYRAVMPSTVRCGPRKLVSAIRRRELGTERCWVDAYVSEDDGRSWFFLSKVGDTGVANGNPPALARLRDGRLCCVYGNRSRRQLLARVSRDEAATWGDERVLRKGYASLEADEDFGYPRLVQRADGCLVAMYYWASAELPYQHTAATIWEAEAEE